MSATGTANSRLQDTSVGGDGAPASSALVDAGCSGRFAVFVDVGYLYATSGQLLFKMTDRSRMKVDAAALIEALLVRARAQMAGGRLLRVYWFDGAKDRVPTVAQRQIALLPGVKVRLGNINAAGQQKGVDALLRSDLEGLAVNGAISDVILVAGDEDMVPAVEAAQAHGVRVHLWGVEPPFGRNQAERLLWESDQVDVLGTDDVEPFFEQVERTPAAPSGSEGERAPAEVTPRGAPAAPGAPTPSAVPPPAPSAPSPAAMPRAARTRAPSLAGYVPTHQQAAYRGREREYMLEVGEHVANRWLVERGKENLADLLPGPTLPGVIDQELLVAAESEIGLSLRPYAEARVALREGFWSRLYREFGVSVGTSTR